MIKINPEDLDREILEASYILGKSIALARKAKGLSQTDLSFDAQVGRSTLVEIESGSPKVQFVHYLKVMNKLGMLHTFSQALGAFNIGQAANSMKVKSR